MHEFGDHGQGAYLGAGDKEKALAAYRERAALGLWDQEVFISLYRSAGIPPTSVTLDIDDTVDVVHGHQQLSLFNAHYDERCFLPIHVYDTATSRPVAVLLRAAGPICWNSAQ